MHDRNEVRANSESSGVVSAGTADLYSTMEAQRAKIDEGLAGPLPQRSRRRLDRSKSSFETTKIDPRTTKKRENSSVGRSGTFGGPARTPGKAFKSVRDAPGTPQERSWDGPSGPKSAQDGSRERPRSLRGPSGRRRDAAQERAEGKGACEQPQHRNFVAAWHDRRSAEPQFSSASAVFC